MKDVTAPASAAPSAAPRSTPDETIVAAQKGDRAAWQTIVSAHQRSVHALMWRMMGVRGRRHLVEDLVQEVFLRVFRSLPRFDPSGTAKFSTWLLTIATRTAIDELRKPRLVPAPLHSVSGVIEARTESPADAAERALVGAAIGRAVEGLGPEIRATFILRAYHELSYGEIGDALGVDVGTVKSRLWRARRALQTELEGVRR